ncbi:hypothetical protein Daesc_001823 [Daldinia eschscholtzii]|uniref:Clr5 domain-containing protein n=1 Tax=Daldinia eschscholtzii TaxID=292717 RepID=A0AAX6MV95_9PEZI
MTKPWEAHEATIKDLYANNTLSVVRQIMIEQYGFKASVRAYRGRLIRWDVRKYNCRKRGSPGISHSSGTDEGSSFTSGSDTSSPVLATTAAAIGDARAILPRAVMKQADAAAAAAATDGHLAMPMRMNQLHDLSQQQFVIFGTDKSKPKAFLSAPQTSGGGGGNNNSAQFEWETTSAPLLKKDPDATDLDDYAGSQQDDGLPPPSSYFSGLAASMMQAPENGNNKSSYDIGYGPATASQHRNINGGGSGLGYYNPSAQQQQQQQQHHHHHQQQQARNAIIGVNQVPPDMSFVTQTRGYGHEGMVHG